MARSNGQDKNKILIFLRCATAVDALQSFPSLGINIFFDAFAGKMGQESLHCLYMLWANCLLASVVNICCIMKNEAKL